jgi:large subunit ribosomal protein L31
MPKEKIHPNYDAVRVMCACGSNFETRSTHKGDIHVEICSVCHPFRRKFAKSDKAVAAAK